MRRTRSSQKAIESVSPISSTDSPKKRAKKSDKDTTAKDVKQAPSRSKTPKKMDHFEAAVASLQQLKDGKLNIKTLQDLKKQFKQTCDKVKRETQIIEQENAAKKIVGTTRSGARRGYIKRPVYTDGKWVNKGIDDSQEKFDADELQYLKKNIAKIKKVDELKFEHLKYLVVDVFLEELKAIKEGKSESDFHSRYKELAGKSKMDLFAEVKTSLFTNEQRDYLNGLLQGAFGTDNKDDNGDIRHSEIDYIEIVMLAEVTMRIVMFVHKFDSSEEALDFMVRKSREALGLGDEDD